MKGDGCSCPKLSLTVRSSKTMKPNKRSKPDWTSLPGHLLRDIALRLKTRNDSYIFRAVCKTFMKAVPKPPLTLFPHPYLKISAPIGPDTTNRGHFSVTESTVYSIQPVSNKFGTAKPWLVKIQELENGKVLVKDFLSRYYFKNLPTEYLPGRLNLMDFRVKELTKAHELQLTVYDEKEIGIKLDFEATKTFFVQKVIITLGLEAAEVGFAVMAIHDGGTVHVWRQGDGNWSKIRFGNRSSFEDMIYYRKKFYVMDHQGLVIAVNPKTLNMVEVAGPLPDMDMGFRYFLESFGQLFMIIKYWSSNYPKIRRDYKGINHYPVSLEVFKLDEKNREWVEVTDEFKDRVAFVGDDCSFSVPAKELPGCEGNHVFVGDIVFAEEANDHPGWHVGVFNLSNGTAVPIRDFPNYPNMFWPPPMWLRQESTSAGL